MSQPSQTAHSIFSISALHAHCMKQLNAQLSVHGINFTEFMILQSLENAAENTMRRIELANAVNLTASGVTRVLHPMERIHLIEKRSNPRDARISLVKLTSAGKTIYADALITVESCAESLMAPLTSNQIETLTGLIKKLSV
ncbi:DNA-binding transcriptional regulator, MarR family [Halodesulfovibrio aestuarii]|uniref:DNA-binding transcriptional regulator, MarR family n=2 Tax=Halodesulfovibrio aestuarii TaxID=126333 RepID=A0A8G2FAY3_9BACT|nr:DNA-binding transcriptional regulator, MarR family [Halodesulfovibrio aestuarii]